MEVKMIKLPDMPVIVGRAQNCNNRPLMINAWSQTTNNDFSYLNEIEIKGEQSQRELELEEKIRILEENLKYHSELLSEIHATTARTTALFAQQPSTTKYNNVNSININSTSTSRPPQQLSPKIVNAINPAQQQQQDSDTPAESVTYKIIAEGSENDNEEPFKIQLAEDDGALNINCSADSRRLEICLDQEENIDIKQDDHEMAATTSSDTTPNESHFIKRFSLGAEQHEALTTSTSTQCLTDNQAVNFSYNVLPKQPVQKRRSSGNKLKTPKVLKINNMQTSTPIPDLILSPTNNSNSSNSSLNGDTNTISIDMDNVMVSIGPNDTRIPAKLYKTMNWSSASIATRKLLMAIFDRNVLATHTMTGRPSPAFKDHGKPLKQQLDPLVIADIIYAVTRKCGVLDKEVRNAITTKCADENKMMKLQMIKRTTMGEMNKENIMH